MSTKMGAQIETQTGRTSADERLEKLWIKYKELGDVEAKNELLISYMGLVERIVRKMR